MVKGHNKSSEHATNKTKGQDEHLSKKEREKKSNEKKGRHPGENQSGGSKGKNNV